MLKAGAAEKTCEETAGGSDEDLVARIAAGDDRRVSFGFLLIFFVTGVW